VQAYYDIYEYLPGEVIYDTIEAFEYYTDVGFASGQGLIMAIAIVGVIIFKLYNKLNAPTKK